MNKKNKGFNEQMNPTQCYERLQESGEHYTSIGDYAQAQICYGKAASLSPDKPGPYLGIGVVALQEDLLDDADIAFRVACRLDPNCSRAYAGMAMVAHKKDDYKKAFEMYLKSLELDTDNLTALLGLFQTSCQMASFSKIIHYLEQYLGTHPKDSSVMFSLAALYVKEDNFEKSRDILLDVLTLAPENEDAANLLEEVDRSLPQRQQSGVQVL